MIDYMRQTGRTTRLLQRAIELADYGRAVYILAHDDKYARMLRKQLAEMIELREPSQPRNPNDLKGIQIERVPPDFDFTTMRPHNSNAWPNCIWLIDHVVAEQEADRLTRALISLATEQVRLQQLQARLLHHTY